MHRNSQKRFYDEFNTYFITTNTKDRFPYFKEDLFCELFIENLRFCKKLKEFELYAFSVLPDHIHLLVYPYEKFNISKIIQNLKRVTSLQINQIMNLHKPEGENIYSRLQVYDFIVKANKKFVQKYGSNQTEFPRFSWQQSFHDHVIRGELDFKYHYDYTIYNPEQHGLCQNAYTYPWSNLNPRFNNIIDAC